MEICEICGQKCANPGRLAIHMQKHDREQEAAEPAFIPGHPPNCDCFRCHHRTTDTVTWQRDPESYAYGTQPRRISGDRAVTDLDVTDDDTRTSSEIMQTGTIQPGPAQYEETVLRDLLRKLESGSAMADYPPEQRQLAIERVRDRLAMITRTSITEEPPLSESDVHWLRYFNAVNLELHRRYPHETERDRRVEILRQIVEEKEAWIAGMRGRQHEHHTWEENDKGEAIRRTALHRPTAADQLRTGHYVWRTSVDGIRFENDISLPSDHEQRLANARRGIFHDRDHDRLIAGHHQPGEECEFCGYGLEPDN
jgi:hypothetical protein